MFTEGQDLPMVVGGMNKFAKLEPHVLGLYGALLLYCSMILGPMH